MNYVTLLLSLFCTLNMQAQTELEVFGGYFNSTQTAIDYDFSLSPISSYQIGIGVREVKNSGLILNANINYVKGGSSLPDIHAKSQLDFYQFGISTQLGYQLKLGKFRAEILGGFNSGTNFRKETFTVFVNPPVTDSSVSDEDLILSPCLCRSDYKLIEYAAIGTVNIGYTLDATLISNVFLKLNYRHGLTPFYTQNLFENEEASIENTGWGVAIGVTRSF